MEWHMNFHTGTEALGLNGGVLKGGLGNVGLG